MKLIVVGLLVSTFSSLTMTEVVNDFNSPKCSKAFIQRPNTPTIITPTLFKGDQYKQICQCWRNNCRFATLYDTERRIPVYSAYTYSGGEKQAQSEEWKNEPQLENINDPNMREISEDEMDKFNHQAVQRDYRESKKNSNTDTEYTSGQLFTYKYAADENHAASTFTFTNVAPQTQHSNSEWAKLVEKIMKIDIRKCKPSSKTPTYIVTGVVPGENWISIRREGNTIENGVNIPSYYWTAFCCYISKNETHSKAYLSLQNQPNITTYELSRMSVDRLNVQLTGLYEKDFSVFSQLCLFEHK